MFERVHCITTIIRFFLSYYIKSTNVIVSVDYKQFCAFALFFMQKLAGGKFNIFFLWDLVHAWGQVLGCIIRGIPTVLLDTVLWRELMFFDIYVMLKM